MRCAVPHGRSTNTPAGDLTVTLCWPIVDVHVYFNQVVNGTLSILLGSLGIYSGTLFKLPQKNCLELPDLYRLSEFFLGEYPQTPPPPPPSIQICQVKHY